MYTWGAAVTPHRDWRHRLQDYGRRGLFFISAVTEKLLKGRFFP
jgi:hypothetical protein